MSAELKILCTVSMKSRHEMELNIQGLGVLAVYNPSFLSVTIAVNVTLLAGPTSTRDGIDWHREIRGKVFLHFGMEICRDRGGY